jgi:transcriptional regulator with XRE-family HTH domain
MSDATAIARAIGTNAREIRLRRDLDLAVAAGLAGISGSYLSRLENGERFWTRRGLVEDVAAALSCSVADLTGQPYLAQDRDSVAVAAAIPEIAAALYDCTLSDVPDQAARPIEVLTAQASRALAYSDDVQLHLAGRGLDALLTELHVHAVTGDGETRRAALAALVQVCITARSLAGTMGHPELAVAVAQRGYDAARLLERPDLVGLMAMGRTMTLSHVGARRRALKLAEQTLAELPTAAIDQDTRAVQARGMLHLSAALISARAGSPGDGATHFQEAHDLAARVGEGNHLRYHFGPTNVSAWSLSIAVETETGPEAAERYVAAPIDPALFGSRDREVSVHLDLARAWAQAEGDRDEQVIHAIDAADRIAPVRVRNDPIARDLVLIVRRRFRRRMWELDSLCNRLSVT